MLYKTLSAAVYGIDANIIEVEVDVSGVKTNEDHFHTVGLPDAAVRESRDRVRAALRNCGYDIPLTHINNQSGACRHKEGRLRIRLADGARNSGRIRRSQQKGNLGLLVCRRAFSGWRRSQCSRCAPDCDRSS